MSSGFEGKTFFVTGASSGIGRAVCIELAQRGSHIALVGRNHEELKATLSAMNGEDHLLLCEDLCNFLELPALIDRVFQWRPVVDGFAHCAGVAGRSRLRDTTYEMLLSRMNINCFSFVELLRLLVKRKKKEQPMQVVAISSLAALGHDKYLSAYAASKAALEATAKTLAVELLPRHVLINIVRCAFVETPMALSGDAFGDFAAQLKESGYQPLGLIPPSVVASMVALLFGPEAAYCTGQIITINAGATE